MPSFRCGNCGAEVGFEAVGTKHRNHCPQCLWSKHLDDLVPGDRDAVCHGMMKPLGLTFKNENGDKGEIMVVHSCMKCGIIQKNRIAGDDKEESIMALFEQSLKLTADELAEVKEYGIRLTTKEDEREIVTQLYGKPEAERRYSQ